jgi:predicted GTPase
MSNQMIEILNAVEGVIERNNDLLADEASALRLQCGVIPAVKLEEQLAKIDQENRLLTIGIIGRVKAGKSSLLNSIFFEGKSVLPKAATPMTAALTILTHGNEWSAAVEYFTEDDLAIIRREHREVQEKFDKLYTEKKAEAEAKAKKKGGSPDYEKAERQTKAELQDIPQYASFDQFDRMMKSGQDSAVICKKKHDEIPGHGQEDLLGKLNAYVGSKGALMPFSKSVEIRMPIDDLRDIRVVDTPGINDPVKSREQRTEEYLRECDVVFIISPAGQFMSAEDLGLMDRITSKNGVRELYLVASQADNQLYGSVREEANGVLTKAIEKLRKDLSEQAINTLRTLKQNNPEVKDQFDEIINGGKDRVMITSAICNAMSLHYGERAAWDEDEQLAWQNLSENYPDNFVAGTAGKASLELLSSIDTVKEKIKISRAGKEKIIAEKTSQYTSQQSANIESYVKALRSFVLSRITELNNTDIESTKQKKKALEDKFLDGKEIINTTLTEYLDNFKMRLRETLSHHSRQLEDAAGQKVSAEEGSRTETERIKQSGFGGGLKRFFGNLFGNDSSGYETRTTEVRTLRAGAVKREIEKIVRQYDEDLELTIGKEVQELKESLPQKIYNAFREIIGDELLDASALRRAMSSFVSAFSSGLEFSFSSPRFDYPASGEITDDEIEEFSDATQDYLLKIQSSYKSTMNGFLKQIESNASSKNPSQAIFGDIQKDIDRLELELQNKKSTIERLENVSKELEKVK